MIDELKAFDFDRETNLRNQPASSRRSFHSGYSEYMNAPQPKTIYTDEYTVLDQ